MPEPIENYIPQTVIAGLRKKSFMVWGIVLFFVFGWVFLLIFAPFAKANGWIEISNPIYNFYSYICHQLPDRSFHILEHQFAVCSRCFGVYFGLLLGMVIYPIFRSMEETEPLPRFWLFAAMIPMGVDFSLTFFGIWENTHLTRVVSGLILGFACAVYIVPALVELSQLILIRRKRTPGT